MPVPSSNRLLGQLGGAPLSQRVPSKPSQMFGSPASIGPVPVPAAPTRLERIDQPNVSGGVLNVPSPSAASTNGVTVGGAPDVSICTIQHHTGPVASGKPLRVNV